MLRLVPLRLLVFALALLLGTPVLAQDLGTEARRQLELAREDLAQGNAERALTASQSALRMDPMLYEAMVVTALAYEKLGETIRAKALLTAYVEMTSGMQPLPEAVAALDRMTSKQDRKAAEKARKKSVKAVEKARKKSVKAAEKARKKGVKAAERDAKRADKAAKKADKAAKKADKAAKKADKAAKKAELKALKIKQKEERKALKGK